MTRYEGLGGNDYHNTRLHFPTVKFSLQSRIHAICYAISEFHHSTVEKLLDVGSADGLLAQGIKALNPNINNIYGLDMDSALLKHNLFPSAQGDCCQMPFPDNTFDVITAAALIEHLLEPRSLLKECYRVLKSDGALLLTCPSPFFEWIATKIGYLKNSGHVARYRLSDIRRLCESAGFMVAISRKFMVSPLYFPGHLHVESLLRKMGVSFLMFNQLVGSVKSTSGRKKENR